LAFYNMRPQGLGVCPRRDLVGRRGWGAAGGARGHRMRGGRRSAPSPPPGRSGAERAAGPAARAGVVCSRLIRGVRVQV